MIFCVAENRSSEETGVRLLLLSLRAVCNDVQVHAFLPTASDAFCRWAEEVFPKDAVFIRRDWPYPAQGWDVKAWLLLKLLDEGYDEIVWLDSDIIVTRDFRELTQNSSDETFVACEETYWGQHQGGIHRTESWGFVPGRALPCTVNTGLIRVTAHHRHLLVAWRELLQSEEYRSAQSRPLRERSIHLLGDQEVLTALLGAEQFADTPIRLLRRGIDIVQHLGPAGYAPLHRLRSALRGSPPLLHMIGKRPWHFEKTPSLLQNPRAYYDALGVEVSPYCVVAKRFRSQLGMNAAWADRVTLPGVFLQSIALGHPSLRGFPLAVVDHVLKAMQSLLGIQRFSIAAGPSKTPLLP